MRKTVNFFMVLNFVSAGVQIGAALDNAVDGNSWMVLLSAVLAAFNYGVASWLLKTRDEA